MPGKVQAQLMGHEKVDTSVNVYNQVIDGAQRAAAEQVGRELKSELFTIDHAGQGAQEPFLRESWLTVLDDFRTWLIQAA